MCQIIQPVALSVSKAQFKRSGVYGRETANMVRIEYVDVILGGKIKTAKWWSVVIA